MTIGEALENFSLERGISGDEFFVVGIDVREDQAAEPSEFTALGDDYTDVTVYPEPRTVVRKYIGGDKTIPVSEKIKICFSVHPNYDDELLKRLLAAAYSSDTVRCAYAQRITGEIICCELFPIIAAVKDDEIFGKKIIFELS